MKLMLRSRATAYLAPVFLFLALVLTLAPAAPHASGAQTGDDVIEIELDGAGPLRIGADIATLGDELPDGWELSEAGQIAPGLMGSSIMVDGAIYALVSASDDATVDLIILVNRIFRTPDGVGPGVALAVIEQDYGAASLSWDPDQAGREIVEFANGPDVTFVTSDAGGPRAGVYGEDEFATDVYKPAARLTTVWVDCRTNACVPGPALAGDAVVAEETEAAEPEPEPEPEVAEEEMATPSDDMGALPNTGATSNRLAAIGAWSAGWGCLLVGLVRRRHQIA